MTAITLSNVSRAYDGRNVLDGVSLHAPSGAVLALLGQSGSGKSTILRLIAGLEPLDAGKIHLGDHLASALGHAMAPEVRRVGMVFQDYALFPHLNALHNVAFGLNMLPRADRERMAQNWLERVGLSHRAAAYPHELSGGEQQRVALARALAPNPRAILLDEPFSGLDPSLRAELRTVTLQALSETATTAIFVTHDAEEALMVADRLAVLSAGRVLQEADPREAYDQPRSAAVAAALGPVNIHRARAQAGVAATPFGPVSAAHFADGAEVDVVVRAEAVTLQPNGGVRVRDVRPHGAHDLVRVEAQGVVWSILAPPRTVSGGAVSTTFQASGVFVFAAGD